MDDSLNGVRPKRCAIYTRKSAQPPQNQEITSLESQRAICSAYVASQQHKNWLELEKKYDDPGRSGSNLVRPALQDLVADIELGHVDIVLVYKLDRITRTLLDFVRLIDFFDRYGVVFVAITQNFDTSDSMGRLIRNILLTFAQFEREIASDRMRDKKMVMKQRGRWTGGDAPLGYDLRRGKLQINKGEAVAIRCIFDTYIQTKSISAVYRRLMEDGHRRKMWRSRSGVRKGGGFISLTSLHHVLQNPVYIGEVTYRSERYPGIHEAILDRPTWERVQACLKEREQFKPRRAEHILTGLIFDSFGRRMHGRIVPNCTAYCRHYVSATVNWGLKKRLRLVRASAAQLEQLILASLSTLMVDPRRLREFLMPVGVLEPRLDNLCDRGSAAAARLNGLDLRQLASALKVIIYRVEVLPEQVRVIVRQEVLAQFVDWDGFGTFSAGKLELARAPRLALIEISAAVDRVRRGICLPIEDRKGPGKRPSENLVGLLEDARLAQKLVYDHRDISLADLARSLGRKPASFARLIRLNFLAPDIVTAIIDGVQPDDLSRRKLMDCDLPIDWDLQRRMLGFPPRLNQRSARSTLPAVSRECGFDRIPGPVRQDHFPDPPRLWREPA